MGKLTRVFAVGSFEHRPAMLQELCPVSILSQLFSFRDLEILPADAVDDLEQ